MSLRSGKAQNESFAVGGSPRLRADRDFAHLDLGQVRELRSVLEQSGPLFSCVGRYLAARIDLLAPEICEELHKIPDHSPTSPAAAVAALVLTEFGYSPDTLFLRFEPVPFESRLLFQTHRALLADGTRVVVRVIHPELNFRLDEPDVMPLIEAVIADFTSADAAVIARGFKFFIERELDFNHTAEALQKFAVDARARGTERIIEVRTELCSSRVLTFTNWGVHSVHEVLAAAAVPPSAGGDLARTIATGWMLHSLLGDAFPIEPDAEDIAIFMPYTAAFAATGAATLSTDTRAALWQYLVAAAADDSDKACSALLRALAITGVRIEDELKKRFRQVVAFRDGGWTGPAAYGFAERLFTHWKTASGLGLLPDSALAEFYRGLYTVYRIAHQIAPDQDNLMHAWREVRLAAGLNRMAEMLTPEELTAFMDRYLGAMAEFPDRVDEVLTLGAGKFNQSAYFNRQREPRERRPRSSSPILTVLLLLLSAAALLVHRFAASPVPRSVALVFFVIVGFAILRVMQRTA
jgi:predicted unusual protein kinase regulating ubiquinone biosynthesis (AarF/ABC1/UbiB family)